MLPSSAPHVQHSGSQSARLCRQQLCALLASLPLQCSAHFLTSIQAVALDTSAELMGWPAIQSQRLRWSLQMALLSMPMPTTTATSFGPAKVGCTPQKVMMYALWGSQHRHHFFQAVARATHVEHELACEKSQQICTTCMGGLICGRSLSPVNESSAKAGWLLHVPDTPHLSMSQAQQHLLVRHACMLCCIAGVNCNAKVAQLY